MQLPVGMTYEIGGQYETQQSSFRELLYVSGLAMGAVLIVLVIQFRAFKPALIILSSVSPLFSRRRFPDAVEYGNTAERFFLHGDHSNGRAGGEKRHHPV